MPHWRVLTNTALSAVFMIAALASEAQEHCATSVASRDCVEDALLDRAEKRTVGVTDSRYSAPAVSTEAESIVSSSASIVLGATILMGILGLGQTTGSEVSVSGSSDDR